MSHDCGIVKRGANKIAFVSSGHIRAGKVSRAARLLRQTNFWARPACDNTSYNNQLKRAASPGLNMTEGCQNPKTARPVEFVMACLQIPSKADRAARSTSDMTAVRGEFQLRSEPSMSSLESIVRDGDRLWRSGLVDRQRRCRTRRADRDCHLNNISPIVRVRSCRTVQCSSKNSPNC